MTQQLFLTADGSHSIRIPELNVSYHSKYGAIRESQHLFINTGLNKVSERLKNISILEVGFGTGLNAFLTYKVATENGLQIFYDVVEKYPLDIAVAASLNYTRELNVPELQDVFMRLHECDWDGPCKISDQFILNKMAVDIRSAAFPSTYDLVYFDAFDPAAQPDLWTADVFKKIIESMNVGGVLVTFSCKGEVKRAMLEAGFGLEKLAGPAGKREILRATKPPDVF